MGTPTSERPAPDAGSFAQRMIEIINDGALAVLMSIGHRTGLFDAMASQPASSAVDIAGRAGLSERYVHDWLEGMVRAGIVSRDLDSAAYELPSEHAACLSGPAVRTNLAALAEFVPFLGVAEDRIVERFQKGRRTPYDARPSFRQLISKTARESDQAIVDVLVETIFPLVPGVLEALHAGIECLDIGCGSGRGVNLMASAFPKSRFHGYDPLVRHIDRAGFRAFELGLTNAHFRVRDSADLDERERYDLITDFDAIRDQTRPRQVLENVYRALRPGAILLMQEVAGSSPLDESLGLPSDSLLHLAGSLAAIDAPPGALGGEQKLRGTLLEIGFENVVVRRLPHHMTNCYFVATKGRS
jgi:SAM-dependent methyltransferase